MAFVDEASLYTNQPLVIMELSMATTLYLAAIDIELDNYYEGRVLSFGKIYRSVSDIESSFEVSDITTVFDNTDNYFGDLTQTSILNRVVTYKLGFQGDAIGAYETIFTGVIVDFSYDDSTFTIIVRDRSSLFLEKNYGGVIDGTTFSNAAPGVVEQKMPILYGDLKSLDTGEEITQTIYSSNDDGWIENTDTVWADARQVGTYVESMKLTLETPDDLGTIPVLTVSEGTQSATLVAGDFDAYETESFGNFPIKFATDEESYMNLNGKGVEYVTSLLGSGTAKICLRDHRFDVPDIEPGEDVCTSVSFYSGDEATKTKPALSVTYNDSSTSTVSSTAADGFVNCRATSWSGARDAASGTYTDNSSTIFSVAAGDCVGYPNWSVTRGFLYFDVSGLSTVTTTSDTSAVSSDTNMSAMHDGSNYRVSRSFFKFETEGLPYGSSVTSATLSLYKDTNGDTNVVVQEGTQGSPLTPNDFEAFTGPSFGSVSFSGADEYKDIGLNFDALQYIAAALGTGSVKFCAREEDYDYDDVAPVSNDYENGCYFSEETGVTKDPKLVITYTPQYGGVVPAVCIDQSKSLWLVAGHEVRGIDEVFTPEKGTTKQPTLVDPADYIVHTDYSYSGGLDSKIAVVEFLNNKPLITDQVLVNVRGMMDGSGDLITNPIEQMEHFIKEYLGMTSAEYDTANFTATASTADTRSYNTGGIIANKPIARVVLEEMAQSIGASLFFDKNGKLNVDFLL